MLFILTQLDYKVATVIENSVGWRYEYAKWRQNVFYFCQVCSGREIKEDDINTSNYNTQTVLEFLWCGLDHCVAMVTETIGTSLILRLHLLSLFPTEINRHMHM